MESQPEGSDATDEEVSNYLLNKIAYLTERVSANRLFFFYPEKKLSGTYCINEYKRREKNSDCFCRIKKNI